MIFKEVLSQHIDERKLDDELFLQKVSNYSSIEDALSELDDEFISYFSKYASAFKGLVKTRMSQKGMSKSFFFSFL